MLNAFAHSPVLAGIALVTLLIVWAVVRLMLAGNAQLDALRNLQMDPEPEPPRGWRWHDDNDAQVPTPQNPTPPIDWSKP